MKTKTPPHYEDQDQERDHGFDWLTPEGVDTVLAEAEEYRELITVESGRTTHWFDGPSDALVKRGVAPPAAGSRANRERRRRRVKSRRKGRDRRLGEVRS